MTPEASDELVNLEAGTPIARAILPDVWKRHALKACQGLVSGLIAVCITLGVVLSLK